MKKILLKPVDRQVYKYAPDQMVLRINEIVRNVNGTNIRTKDLNGWKVFEYGDWKEYEYVADYDVTVASGQRNGIITIPPPAGRTIDEFSYAVNGFGNYAGHAVYGVDPTGPNLNVVIGNQYSGGPLNFTGKAFIRLREL